LEHRIILGGESFLPFARSCVAKLKKLGLAHASQSFEIDGVSIKVRIEPGHEYIRIDGNPLLPISMDSGIVDLRWEYGNPDGVLYKTTGYANYVSGYIVNEVGNWKEQPSERALGTYGQLAGRAWVSRSKAYGQIELDSRAKSYSAGVELTTDDPPVYARMKNDLVLKDKKQQTPASQFTGRTRLYVQAIYGSHLYEFQNSPGTNYNNTSGKPVIKVGQGTITLPTSYADERKDEENAITEFTLSTSSGVWFDPETGKHWLFEAATDALTVFQMAAPKKLEFIHKLLSSSNPRPLPQSERVRLETYLLSVSLPIVSSRQVIQFGETIIGDSFGYRWHWNFSGTAADIVALAGGIFAETNTNYYDASHYRINPTKSADDVWTVSLQAVEKNKQFVLDYHYWCVLFPIWDNQHSRRLGKGFNVMIDCDAPLYVFYKGDDVQLCRFKGRWVDLGPGVREVTNEFAHNTAYQGQLLVYQFMPTTPLGKYTDTLLSSRHFEGTFTVGSAEITSVDSKQETVNEVGGFGTERVPFGEPANGGAIYGVQYVPYSNPPEPQPHILESGRESARVGGTFAKSTLYGRYQLYYGGAQATFITRNYTKYTAGTALFVVPHYDAEAVYMSKRTWTREVGSESAGTQSWTDTRQYRGIDFGGSVVTNTYYGFFYAGEATPLPDQSGPFDIETIEHGPLKIYGKTSADTTLECDAAYFAGIEEVISFIAPTQSGVSTTDPVIYAPKFGVIKGSPTLPTDASVAIVGWV